MAKRAASGKGGVVIAQEIFALVQGNKAIKGPEVMTALREKFPKVTFNENSCQVAYANARKKLGLTRTMAKRPIGSGSSSSSPRQARAQAAPAAAAAPTSTGAIDINLLQAAKALLQHCNGDAGLAKVALTQIAALQMG
jgi:hypothetical protein